MYNSDRNRVSVTRISKFFIAARRRSIYLVQQSCRFDRSEGSCRRSQHQQQRGKHRLIYEGISQCSISRQTSVSIGIIYLPAAPILSAKSYNIWKFSPFFIPRPPEITRLALFKSGRSLLINSSPIHSDKATVSASGAAS